MPAGRSQLPDFRYATHTHLTPSSLTPSHSLPTHLHTHTHTHVHHHTLTLTLLTHTHSPSHIYTHTHAPHTLTLTLLTHTHSSSHIYTPHTLTPHTPHIPSPTLTLLIPLTHTLTDLPLQLNHAKFEFNGATGYILKPWVMLTEKTRGGAFNPFTQSKLEDIVPAKLSIKVIPERVIFPTRCMQSPTRFDQ